MEPSLHCNKCFQPFEHGGVSKAISTCCGHLFCAPCSEAAFNPQSKDFTGGACVMQCPLCDETLMKSNLKAVNVLANTADIKMALFGQAPDAIMEVALQAIKFFNLQQQVVSEARETRLADKAIQIRDQCNTKLAEFQNAYNNVKRKYQAVTQENTNMKVETRELHDKYAAKSKQNLNLQRMLSEVNINSARGRGGGSGGGGGVMANNMGPRSSSLSNLSNGSGGSGGHMVTTVHRQQMFSLGGTTPPRDPTMGGYGTDRLPAMMRGSTGPAHASGSAAQASQRREILQLLPGGLPLSGSGQPAKLMRSGTGSFGGRSLR